MLSDELVELGLHVSNEMEFDDLFSDWAFAGIDRREYRCPDALLFRSAACTSVSASLLG